MKTNLKEQGITLIALVITIVILIILATVTLDSAFGETGLIETTKKAKEMVEDATKNEQEQINSLFDSFENLTGDTDIEQNENSDLIVSLNLLENTKSATIIVNATDNLNGIKSIKLLNQEKLVKYDNIPTTAQEQFIVYENGIYEIEVTNGTDEVVKKSIEVKNIVMEYVAQINDTKYTTLTSAIEAVPAGEKTVINIIKDFEQTVIAKIPEEKDVVIDLQNFDITITTGSILNKGNLELKSSSQVDIGKIIIQNNEYLGINNIGSMLISSGCYENNATNNTIGNNDNGTITITGGKISATSIEGEEYPGIWNEDNGTLTIKGGTLEASSPTLVYNKGDGNIYVESGTLTSYLDATIENAGNGKVVITTGTLQSTANTTLINSGSGTMEIKGGEIAGCIAGGKAYPTVRNYSNGEIIIDGGNITATLERAVYNDKSGNITIKNGVIQSTKLNSVGNYGEGTITISGGEIRGIESADISYPTVWNSKGGKIVMNGGLIDASVGNGTSTAINNAGSGEIIITSGTVKSRNYAINNSGTGTITLGEDDGYISTTSPEIISSNNSTTIVGKANLTLNFFDGIIKGGGIQSNLNIIVPTGKSYYKNTSKAIYETIIK